MTGPLLIAYFVLQFAIGAITPLLLRSYILRRGTTGKVLIVRVTLSARLVLFSVLMMRWNMVIGGQEISRTGKGLFSYHLPFFGKGGALVAIVRTVAPRGVLYVLTRLFPPWADAATHTYTCLHLKHIEFVELEDAYRVKLFYVDMSVRLIRNAILTWRESNMKRVMILAGTVAVLMVSGQLAAADGKAVFEKTCAGCHKVMSPKMGDKAAWAPRIAQGADALTASVMKGKNPMPPKGGAATEADVKAAVEYMIKQNK